MTQPVFRMDRSSMIEELVGLQLWHSRRRAAGLHHMSTSRLRRELIAARCQFQACRQS